MPTWFPLESNPELMNKYITSLGAQGVGVQEVLSVEDWALDMVEGEVKAVLFLYPLTQPQREHEAVDPPKKLEANQPGSGIPFFMRQTVGNACGTVALLHALANAAQVRAAAGLSSITSDGSWLASFVADTREMSPDAAATYIAEGAAAESLERAHTATATDEANATAVETDVDTHFIAFVSAGGQLYELDGRKEGPVAHGSCAAEELLTKAVGAIKGFMERDPAELRFSITVLAEP